MLEKMPIALVADAQRIVDEISNNTDIRTPEEMSRDYWLLSIASVLRDLAKEIEVVKYKKAVKNKRSTEQKMRGIIEGASRIRQEEK